MEDRVNSIFWSETEAEARANGMGPGTLGITVADIPSDGQEQITRVNADITFNGYDHRWTVNGQATDIESIALHEIGHFIGFDHPCEDENETECLSPEESVLSPSYPGGLFQDLGQDDVNAVKYIYKTDTEATCEGPYGLYEPCFDNCECISNLIVAQQMILPDVHRRVLQSKHPVQEILFASLVSQMPQQALLLVYV